MTAMATVITFLYLVLRDAASSLTPTTYLYAQTNGSLGFRLSYIAFAVIVVTQVVLLWTGNLGRFRWFIPIGVEVAICIEFSLAAYRLLRGYVAVGTCTGQGNCTVAYPSPVTAIVVGVVVGVALGAAWRFSWKADQHHLQQSPHSAVPA